MDLIPEVVLLKRLNAAMKSHGVNSKEFVYTLTSLEMYVTNQTHSSNPQKN
jgi:hypothetical protein